MDLTHIIPAWLGITKDAEPSLGLDVGDALKKATALREAIRSGGALAEDFEVSADLAETLYALAFLLERDEEVTSDHLLKDCEAAFHFVEAIPWPEGQFGGRTEVLSRLAFLSWRNARRCGRPSDECRWGQTHGSFSGDSTVAREVAALSNTPLTDGSSEALAPFIDDSERFLLLTEHLRDFLETNPSLVRVVASRLSQLLTDQLLEDGVAHEKSEFSYGFLQKPRRKIGLLDERDYYLGELALTAGTACRVLSRREEARRWFDCAEASFTRSANGLAHVARLGYQRLALGLEERRIDEVLEMAPLWRESFESMGMPEDALKCRFLEGIALREKGQFAESVEAFRDICRQAEQQGNDRLVATASNNLAQYCRLLGNLDEAMLYARKALPIYKQIENKVGLVKLRWSVGNILREQGKFAEAAEAYREAREEARAVGMRGDVAALHLVLADVLLDAGQDRQAEWEVRAALPIIEEERMVPEGFAALDFLRKALRLRQIDRKALRELHGYFREQSA